MKLSRTQRVAAAVTLIATAGATGIAMAPAGAITQVVYYTCAGATNDTAGKISVGNRWVNSATMLTELQKYDSSIELPLIVPVTVDANAPASVNAAGAATATFDYAIDVPQALVDTVKKLNKYSIKVGAGNISMKTSGATPAQVNKDLEPRTISLNQPGAISIREQLAGSFTPTPGAYVIDYLAGPANVRLDLNLSIPVFGDLNRLNLQCDVPAPRVLSRTVIAGNASTTAAPTTAAPTTAAPTTAAPTTTAAPAGDDVVTVAIRGGLNYNASSSLTSGNLKVALTNRSASAISGSGTYPGVNGGTARVTVNASNFLWWSFGTISVNDPGAGIRNLSTPLVFASPVSGSLSSARATGSWLTWNDGLVNYTVAITVADNG